MDFLIYQNLQDVSMLQCMVNSLESQFEDVFACGYLVTIKDSREDRSRELIIRCIKDCLKNATFQKQDVLYVFFAEENKQIKLWPLKRTGRSKMHRLETGFSYYQI